MRLFGLSFLTRTSAGDLNLIGYHPRSSPTWYWSVTLIKADGWGSSRAKGRSGQWHDYYRVFGRTICVSQQDWHKSSPPPTTI